MSLKKLLTLTTLCFFFLFLAKSIYAACNNTSYCLRRSTTPASITINPNGDEYSFSAQMSALFTGQTFCLKVTDSSGNLVGEEDLYIGSEGQSTTTRSITITQPGVYSAGIYDVTAQLCANGRRSFTVPDVSPGVSPTPEGASGPAQCEAGETWVDTFKGCYSFSGFVSSGLEWLMIAAALLALFRLTVGGIQYIFSQGQPDRLESAQATITSAIFGLILVFIAWVLIQFVGENTPEWWNVNFFSITSP